MGSGYGAYRHGSTLPFGVIADDENNRHQTVAPATKDASLKFSVTAPSRPQQRRSSVTNSLNPHHHQPVTGETSHDTADQAKYSWSTNDATAPTPRDLCGGDGRPARRLPDVAEHPGTASGQADPRAAGAAARPTGQSGSAGQQQALIRAQALAELLNDIAEYRAASHPALRAFWRVLALHDIARFRRDYLRPERAAFEAAVAASQRRRAA